MCPNKLIQKRSGDIPIQITHTLTKYTHGTEASAGTRPAPSSASPASDAWEWRCCSSSWRAHSCSSAARSTTSHPRRSSAKPRPLVAIRLPRRIRRRARTRCRARARRRARLPLGRLQFYHPRRFNRRVMTICSGSHPPRAPEAQCVLTDAHTAVPRGFSVGKL